GNRLPWWSLFFERLFRHHRLPPGGDPRRRQPRGGPVRRIPIALLLERLCVEIAEESRPFDERRQLDRAVRRGRVRGEPQRQHVLVQHQREIARAADDVRRRWFFGERPEGPPAAVHREQARDRLGARREILAADEQDARYAARRRRQERRIVDASLVHDE